MPKTADEVLKGVLSTTLQLDQEGVASLYDGADLKDDALEVIKAKDAARVATLTAPVTTLTAEVTRLKADLKGQSMRGKKAAMEEFEQSSRAKYHYDDQTKTGQDLIDAIIAKEVAAATSTDTDRWKTHPEFREMEQKVAKIPELVATARQEERAVFQGEQNIRTVLDEGAVLFRAWKPVLPPDPEMAATVERDFLDKLRSVKFQVTKKEDGKMDIVPLNAEGTGPMLDAHGFGITYKALVEKMASQRFLQMASEAKSGAADPNKTGATTGGGGSGKAPVFADRNEYATEYERILKLPKGEDRASALKALKEANPQFSTAA